MGDSNLKGAGEVFEYTPEQIQEIVKCQSDIIYFAEKYFKIITIDEGEIYIKMYDFQKKIIKSMMEPPDGKRHICLLSGRQIGKTTISSIYILHYILFNSDKTVGILANKEDTANEVLRRIKLAYLNLPYFMQQGIQDGGWNIKSLLLENGSKIVTGTTSSSSIRSKSVSLLYVDEFAHIADHLIKEFQESVFPTIYSRKTSQIILVSTPKGLNHFHDVYTNAVKGKNSFYPIKINWWDVPGRDNEFKDNIIRDFGLQHWKQEYAAEFLGSSSTLIDSDVLQRLNYEEPILTKYGFLFKIYKIPEEGVRYVLGTDAGKGVGQDSSSIQVLKITNERDVEQVATYSNNKIDVFNFAQVIIEISKFYNEADIMIENNGEGSEVANRIWYDYEYDKIVNFEKKSLGINANVKTKLIACLSFKRYVENAWLTIHDKETIRQMTFFEERSENIFKAAGNQNDDLVTSLYWGIYFVSSNQYENQGESGAKIDKKNKLDAKKEDEEGGVEGICIIDY